MHIEHILQQNCKPQFVGFLIELILWKWKEIIERNLYQNTLKMAHTQQCQIALNARFHQTVEQKSFKVHTPRQHLDGLTALKDF